MMVSSNWLSEENRTHTHNRGKKAPTMLSLLSSRFLFCFVVSTLHGGRFFFLLRLFFNSFMSEISRSLFSSKMKLIAEQTRWIWEKKSERKWVFMANVVFFPRLCLLWKLEHRRSERASGWEGKKERKISLSLFFRSKYNVYIFSLFLLFAVDLVSRFFSSFMIKCILFFFLRHVLVYSRRSRSLKMQKAIRLTKAKIYFFNVFSNGDKMRRKREKMRESLRFTAKEE